MKFEKLRILRDKRRKKISFQLTDYGELLVKVPKTCSDSYVRKIYEEHYDDIVEKIKSIRENIFKIELIEGGKIPYLGKALIVEIKKGKKAYRILENKLILYSIDDSIEKVKESFIIFLKTETLNVVREIVSEYDDIFFSKINNIKSKKQSKRWGSCSSKGNLNFNYDLILMDFGFVKYVTIHELCHLFEMNHSKKFWDLVKFYYPEYDRYKKMKKNYIY